MWLGIAWLVVAIVLATGSRAGGDMSIVAGFLWLAWTAPVGMIWQFWVYDSVFRLFGTTVSNCLSLVVVLVVASVFWFVVIPRIVRAARRRRPARL